MLLLLHVYPHRYELIKPEQLAVSPATQFQLFTDHYGNLCTRLLAQPGTLTITNDAMVQVDSRPDPVSPNAMQHPVPELPVETLHFLQASRYCETDRLMEFAWQRFGNGPTGYQRVQAVCTYVHENIKF